MDSVRWKIFYGDYSTYSNQDGSPFNAPAQNVQFIVQENKEVGRHLLARQNHYWWRNGWSGGDQYGMYDYQLELGPQKVIHGRTINSVTYKEILNNALNDPYFLPKSAKLEGEVY